MTFPIDFWTHPKVSRLNDAAFRAFVEANGHSRMRESDGIIEADDAEFLWSDTALGDLLRSHPSRPLMVRDAEGRYRLRDYAEHQFTKADRDRLSQKRREAGAKGLATRALAKQVHSKPQQTDAGIGIGIGIGKALSTSDEVESAHSQRATRIPEPFILTADMRNAMAVECPQLDIARATKQFVDYWRAASGRNAAKKDWVAAWRFWMRREAEQSPTGTRVAPLTRTEQNMAVTMRLEEQYRAEEARSQQGLAP